MSGEAAGLLQLAAALSDGEIDVMCHALGLAKPYELRAKGGRGLSARSCPINGRSVSSLCRRNYYCGTDPRWSRLLEEGLAEHERPVTLDGYAIYRVTPLGVLVALTRWHAEKMVAAFTSAGHHPASSSEAPGATSEVPDVG